MRLAERFDSGIGARAYTLAGGTAFAIALGAIAGHAVRVAGTKSIQALRYE